MRCFTSRHGLVGGHKWREAIRPFYRGKLAQHPVWIAALGAGSSLLFRSRQRISTNPPPLPIPCRRFRTDMNICAIFAYGNLTVGLFKGSAG